jgi:sec-independent protein translocase protein TatB
VIVPFDLSVWKLLVLGIIGLVVFGPDRLPQLARDAGRTVRQLRKMAQAARTELRSELGDTVGDFDFSDLNPRAFVRKHLLDDLDTDLDSDLKTGSTSPATGASADLAGAAAGVPAPSDLAAT